MTLRRWLVVVILIEVVLSTVRVHHLSPRGGRLTPHFRWLDVGFAGTPFYLRAVETHADWRYAVFLVGRKGWGLHYLDDAAGRRVILGGATDPYDLVPAFWIRRNIK